MGGIDRRAAGKNEVAKCLSEEEGGTGDEEDNVDRHAIARLGSRWLLFEKPPLLYERKKKKRLPDTRHQQFWQEGA
jgi:hypothetical protein